MQSALEISPAEAKDRLNASNKKALIDVREPEECALAHLGSAEYIPMSSVPVALPRLQDLAASSDLLVLCHHGVRSLQVVDMPSGLLQLVSGGGYYGHIDFISPINGTWLALAQSGFMRVDVTPGGRLRLAVITVDRNGIPTEVASRWLPSRQAIAP